MKNTIVRNQHRKAQRLKELQRCLAERVTYKYQKAFYAVFFKYQEAVQLSGSVPSINPGRNPGQSAPGAKSSGRVKPTLSDFIADVELAAQSSLSRVQLMLFYRMANMVRIPETGKYALVAEKAGTEFTKRKIYPHKEYFADKRIGRPNEFPN